MKRDEGFTLIELLVVILIIGILAAIAIPTFLNQRGKAYDASAKVMANAAYTTIESYALERGSYEGVTPALLHEEEPSLNATSSSTAELVVAASMEGGAGYMVKVKAASTGDEFEVAKFTGWGGEVRHRCYSTSNGCPGGTDESEVW